LVRPRSLTAGEKAKLSPQKVVNRQRLTHLSNFVSVSWGWYDQSNGVVQWSFINMDSAQHSVVLLRNGYYFGGAFWPVYYANSGGRGASATNPADDFGTEWATALTPLTDNGVANNSPPIAIVDFGGAKRQVYFVFTLAPGETWSMLEGGFSQSMTPSGISLYEVTLEAAGQFCVAYDPARVTAWDAQTGTTLQGYSPNPSTFTTVEVQIEADAPYDVLPFNDTMTDGPCAAPTPGPPNPGSCTQYLDQLAADAEAGDLEAAVSDFEDFLTCLVSSGVEVKLGALKDRLERAAKKVEALMSRDL
jgi:hypothetical protein